VIQSSVNVYAGFISMVAGSATVSTSIVTASSLILVTAQDGTANIGSVRVTGRTSGISFSIISTNILDESTVGWWIIETS